MSAPRAPFLVLSGPHADWAIEASLVREIRAPGDYDHDPPPNLAELLGAGPQGPASRILMIAVGDGLLAVRISGSLRLLTLGPEQVQALPESMRRSALAGALRGVAYFERPMLVLRPAGLAVLAACR